MSSARALRLAALVVASEGGEVRGQDAGLKTAFGPRAVESVGAWLLEHAAAWAAAIAPKACYLMCDGDGASASPLGGLEPLSLAGSARERLEAATRRLIRDRDAVVIIWPVVATLAASHAQAVREDLASGCDVSVGPCHDGGWYLLAVRETAVSLVGGGSFERARAAIGEGGLRFGMLRSERSLRIEADFRALLADPLAPTELVALLR